MASLRLLACGLAYAAHVLNGRAKTNAGVMRRLFWAVLNAGNIAQINQAAVDAFNNGCGNVFVGLIERPRFKQEFTSALLKGPGLQVEIGCF